MAAVAAQIGKVRESSTRQNAGGDSSESVTEVLNMKGHDSILLIESLNFLSVSDILIANIRTHDITIGRFISHLRTILL